MQMFPIWIIVYQASKLLRQFSVSIRRLVIFTCFDNSQVIGWWKLISFFFPFLFWWWVITASIFVFRVSLQLYKPTLFFIFFEFISKKFSKTTKKFLLNTQSVNERIIVLGTVQLWDPWIHDFLCWLKDYIFFFIYISQLLRN